MSHTKGPWHISSKYIGPISKEDDQSYGMILPVAFIEEFDWPENYADNARLIADAPTLLEALGALLMGRHYFSAEEGNNRFCKECGKYFTDAVHYRDGESRNTDEGKARALIAKHRGQS